MQATQSQTPDASKFQINEQIVQAHLENLKQDQNLMFGIVVGSIGGIVGAILWAVITIVTNYQIGWLAVGVGFLAGFGMRQMGKGIDKIFGITGGLIALFSVVLGNFLAILGFVSQNLGVDFFVVVARFDYSLTFAVLKESFSFMDIIFYAIAVYEGDKFSFRNISSDHLLEGAVTPAPQNQP